MPCIEELSAEQRGEYQKWRQSVAYAPPLVCVAMVQGMILVRIPSIYGSCIVPHQSNDKFHLLRQLLQIKLVKHTNLILFPAGDRKVSFHFPFCLSTVLTRNYAPPFCQLGLAKSMEGAYN